MFERITQADHDNDQSYRYAYDPLNRLTIAEVGTLNTANTGFDLATDATKGFAWDLDVLGKFSGGLPSEWSRIEYTPGDTTLEYVEASPLMDTPLVKTHLVTSHANEIIDEYTDGSITDSPNYTADGSLEDYDGKSYTYDAWNRLTQVKYTAGNEIFNATYDALGRWVRKIKPSSVMPGEFFYYEGNCVVHMDEYVQETSWWCPPFGCGGGSQKQIGEKETYDATLDDTHNDAIDEPVVEHTLDMEALFDQFGPKIMTQMA